MNAFQAVWYDQVRSDQEILVMLRRTGARRSHQLHYLQMVTEKLGKAYFWRAGRPPRKSHSSFVRFLQALDDRPAADRARIATAFGFGRARNFQNWLPTVAPLAYDLERLAPALAGDSGPNLEYPWPWKRPANAPALYDFEVWRRLTQTGRGRQLWKVIYSAVRTFPTYG
jgi:hypothetical protein